MSLFGKRGWLQKSLALTASAALVLGTAGCGSPAEDVSSQTSAEMEQEESI